MGVLWVAQHRALGNEVVVKFLREELADDPSAARKIAREAAAAARVKSPHVVQILDHGVADGTPFVVMELLEGADLRTHLEARGPLSPAETIQIVSQLAKALNRTHAAGIVHRDVKPSNIFLLNSEPEIFVKLLDFGLAQRSVSSEGSSTATQHCAGTPPYMSPEQIMGTHVDGRSDVWSLGVVAFQCLTGKRPFEGETLGAVALAVHSASFPRMRDTRPELPAEVDEWFARACARSLDARFSSATEAAEGLARALGQAPASAVSEPLRPQTSHREDRTLSENPVLTRPVLPAPRPAGRTLAPIAVAVSVVGFVAVALVSRAHRTGVLVDHARPDSSETARAAGMDRTASASSASSLELVDPARHGPESPPSQEPTLASQASRPIGRVLLGPFPPPGRAPTIGMGGSAIVGSPAPESVQRPSASPSPSPSSPPMAARSADGGSRPLSRFELPDERY